MEGVGKPPSIEWSILKAVSLSNGIKNGLNQLFSWGEYLFALDPARGSKKMWMWESSAETLAEFGVQERAGGGSSGLRSCPEPKVSASASVAAENIVVQCPELPQALL